MQVVKLIGRNPLVANHVYTCHCFYPNSVNLQILRWKRKPIWLPTAKTKVFRVPVKPNIPREEVLEIQRLYNNYRTYMKSLRHYFYEQVKQKEVHLDQSIIDKEESEDYAHCLEINNEWNEKIAAERKIYREKAKEEKLAQILKSVELKKEKEKQMQSSLDAKVREAKLLSSSFITRDNIDQAIEDALANVVNYNKALTPDGQWYTETSGLPPTTKQDVSMAS